MAKYFVLVACEESQVSCEAFRKLGCEAYSCDLQPCSGGHPEWHIMGDVSVLLDGDCLFMTQDGSYHHVKKWDLLLAHPPCTYLTAVSAPHMFPDHKLNRVRFAKMLEAVSFFNLFYNCNCDHVCIENPRPLSIARLPRPNCVVSPHDFGSKYSKRTYLWLKNLPPIICGCSFPNPKSFVYTCSGSIARSKSDYRMYNEIARQFINYLDYEKK